MRRFLFVLISFIIFAAASLCLGATPVIYGFTPAEFEKGDVTLSHSSQERPLALDGAQRGKLSPHQDFYQHEVKTSAPYLQYAQVKPVGQSLKVGVW